MYAVEAKNATEKICNLVKVELEIRDERSLIIEVEALGTDQISTTLLATPNKYIRKTHNKLKCLTLAHRP